MRTPVFSLLAFLGLSATAAFAQSGDASDEFLNAFLSFQRGEKSELGGNARSAVSLYNQAISILDGISARWPSWNPAIVKHRREKAAEAIARLQPRLAAQSPSRGTRGSRTSQPAFDEPPLPSGPDNVLPPDNGFPSEPEPVRSSGRRGSIGDPLQEIQGRIESLQKDLSATREKLEKVTQEKEAMAKKFDKAVRDASEAASKMEAVQKRADRAEEALAAAEKSGDQNSAATETLRKELAESKKTLRQLQIERDAEAELNDQLSGVLKASRERAQALATERDAAKKESADVPKKIADMQKEIDKVLRDKGDIEGKLGKVQETLTKVTAERDDALTQLTRVKEAAKNVEKLLAENTLLMARLQDAEKQVATFKAEGVEKDKKIAELTKELTSTRTQLADVQKQSAAFQKEMGDLRKQLDDQAKQFTQSKTDNAASAIEKKKLADENDLLRGIVLRQQKEQARRDRVKKIVLEQLAKLEVNSKALIDQVQILGSPVVKLSEKERRLFKQPQLSISDTEITFIAPEAAESEATPPTETAATPAPAHAPAETPATTEAKPAETKPAEAPATKAPDNAKMTAAATPNPEPTPLPDALPDISGGAGKKTELASAQPPQKKPSEAARTPAVEGDLPARDGKLAPIPTAGDNGTAAKTIAQPGVPEELAELVRDAKEQFERGNYREAEKIYEKAIAKVPNNLYVLSNLGVVRFRQEKYKLAVEAFKKAIAIEPSDDFSHCTLGIVHYQLQEYDHAIQALTRALALNPKNATAHNYLGITASHKGWQEAALKHLETSVTLEPNYADAHFNLAVIHATQTPPNKEAARKHYKRAVELGAENDPGLERLIK
jgi:tetratricopeptide (TPR) repeat protein